jgi:CubicO group peptidase (beta-lactamase class C family)
MIRMIGALAIWLAFAIACVGAIPESQAQEEAGMLASEYGQALDFSPNGLNQITEWYQAQVDVGALPGAVVAVARNGKVAYLQAIGYQDRNKTFPLNGTRSFGLRQ